MKNNFFFIYFLAENGRSAIFFAYFDLNIQMAVSWMYKKKTSTADGVYKYLRPPIT